MDKRIFNEYMNEQIIQKIEILGECFSINIDEWHPAKKNSKYPHRIYFYQENNIVGYIDANTRNLKNKYIYTTGQYPFFLFTPIGNVEGVYNTGSQLFDYKITNIDEKEFDELNGSLFIIMKKDGHDIICFSLILKKDDQYVISFNLNGDVLNIKNYQNSEEINCEIGNFNITHNYKAANRKYHNKNNIKLKEYRDEKNWNNQHPVVGNFNFNNEEVYFRDDLYQTYPKKYNIHNIDLEKVNQEIKKHDFRFYEFLQETKKQLIFETDQRTVSLYDNFLYQYFKNKNQEFYDQFYRYIVKGKEQKELQKTKPQLIKKRNNFSIN